MEYFKIVINNNIIGVITSTQFVYYNSIVDSLLRCDKLRGEYAIYKDILYRDTWMNPTTIDIRYTNASILPITQTEYLTLSEALKVDQIIIENIHPDNVVEETPVEVYEDTTTIDFIRTSKINEMSYACNQAIENGFDVEIAGETCHFSLTIQDQLNLITLSSMAAQGIDQIPYHADGELCKFYTAAEINAIVNQATIFKTYHTTYFNALKAYINSLETIEEIGAITYGIELPEEFKTDVLRSLEQ